jgi:hypothetical protein
MRELADEFRPVSKSSGLVLSPLYLQLREFDLVEYTEP